MPKGQGLEIMGNGMVVRMDGRVNLVSSEKRIPLLYTLHPYQWSHLFLAKILFAGQSCKYWLYRKRRNSADGGQAKQHLQAEPDFGLKCLILRTLGLLHSMKGLLHSMNVGYSVYTGKFESKRSLMFILMATILVSTLILHTNDFHSKSAFLSPICKSSRGA